MKTEILQEVREQLNKENDGINTLIIPYSDIEFLAFDKTNKNFFLFNIGKIVNKKNPDNVDLTIVDWSTFMCVKYSILLKEYTIAFEGQPRINFAEKYIENFRNDDNKELIWKLKERP